MSGKIGNTVKVSKTEVLNNKELTTINTMTYDTAGNYLLKKQTTTASDGVDYTTKFYYPEDFNGSVYTSLQNANRLTEVLQAETYEGTSKIATRKTIVKDWGNGAILPEMVQSSKGTTPLENRIIYHKYDSNNNPLEVSQSEGSHTIYVWGYQDRYPIVKITNSSYTGMPADVLDLIAQIRVASHTENSVAEEVTIQGLFEQLRNHIYFDGAEVTGYTYDPQIGVTSITDPKGYTIKYEYDDLQRLKYVRDAEGNLVSRNKYHYKNQ
jgi:YD repeat-containing protein